jgi:tetratricopeptide (TPR) repeat protein
MQALGCLRFATGALTEAEGLLQGALALHLERADRRGEGRARVAIARLYQSTGRPEAARPLYRRARARLERVGDRVSLGALLLRQGQLEHNAGNVYAAQEHLLSALSVFRVAGRRRGEGAVLCARGALYHSMSTAAQPAKVFSQALRQRLELLDRARRDLEAGLALLRACGDNMEIQSAAATLGLLAYDEGHHAEAAALLAESDTLGAALGPTSPLRRPAESLRAALG